jgi:hypothetical protein
MHHPLHFYVFIYLHLTSHLGTLDALRGGHDVELNPKTVLVDPPRRWKAGQVLVGDARQAWVI